MKTYVYVPAAWLAAMVTCVLVGCVAAPESTGEGVGEAAAAFGTRPGCTFLGCDDADPCTVDACTPSGCTHAVAPDGADCRVYAVGEGACLAGECCVGQIDTGSSPWACLACDDGNPCTFDSGTDGCQHFPLGNGQPCNDGSGGVCWDWECVGEAPSCNGPTTCATSDDCFFSQCALSECVGGLCQHTSRDGELCFAGNFKIGECTGCECAKTTAAEKPGVESGTPALAACQLVPGSCDDGNPCTTDACNSWGCNHWPLLVGALCAVGGEYGYCTAGAVCDTSNGPECFTNDDCDDGIACTVDVCTSINGTTVCQNSAAPGGSVCHVGACTGTCFPPYWDGQHEYPGVCGGCSAAEPEQEKAGEGFGLPGCTFLGCNDGNPCTADACTARGCFHVPVLNGMICSTSAGEGICNAGQCCYGAVQDGACDSACDDGNPCTWDDSIEACSSIPFNDGTPCGNGGVCSAGWCSVPSCSLNGACVNEGITCPVGAGFGTCHDCQCVPNAGASEKQAPEAMGFTPTEPCYFFGCPRSTDPCTYSECTDNGCMYKSHTDGSACADDGNPCTGDQCSKGSCVHAALSDGATCAIGMVSGQCLEGACVYESCVSWQDCAVPENPCTAPSCVGGVCSYSATPDGNVCPSGFCVGGVCLQ